ncbi:hypothetical protein AK812_SmicGene38927 [Symbiodinium microadriaticum]|uniref:Uncharacterized protein n=1 Tax=Symbiodinium microadriaticum TaxID=2951 RepID=A0A1Q9CCI1_SYMMI|nr:hypothetical protein AK812_SmicGene38927 [Symbiodinium microadriaticum]CAE7226274.1 unnamed protein product [Symbiodinium microadriaticum]
MGTSFTCRAAASGQRPRARLSERADGDAATPFGDPRALFGQSRNLAAHPWATHRRLPHFKRGKQKQLHMPSSSERLIQLPRLVVSGCSWFLRWDTQAPWRVPQGAAEELCAATRGSKVSVNSRVKHSVLSRSAWWLRGRDLLEAAMQSQTLKALFLCQASGGFEGVPVLGKRFRVRSMACGDCALFVECLGNKRHQLRFPGHAASSRQAAQSRRPRVPAKKPKDAGPPRLEAPPSCPSYSFFSSDGSSAAVLLFGREALIRLALLSEHPEKRLSSKRNLPRQAADGMGWDGEEAARLEATSTLGR